MNRSWTTVWNLTHTHTHSTAGSNGEAIGEAGSQYTSEECEFANVMKRPSVKKKNIDKNSFRGIRECEIFNLSHTQSNTLNLK
jgi:hypothetical protein